MWSKELFCVKLEALGYRQCSELITAAVLPAGIHTLLETVFYFSRQEGVRDRVQFRLEVSVDTDRERFGITYLHAMFNRLHPPGNAPIVEEEFSVSSTLLSVYQVYDRFTAVLSGERTPSKRITFTPGNFRPPLKEPPVAVS